MPELTLSEWSTVGPDADALCGRTLDAADLRLVERLSTRQALFVEERRHGLAIRSRQHVGVVQLGDLRVRIQPKVATRTLWALVQYGLGLDGTLRLPHTAFEAAPSVVDLVARMLLLQAQALRGGGMASGYVERREWRASPRGRPDLATLVRHMPLTRAALPCRHHPFTTDIVANQVVAAALDLARRRVGDRSLRSQLHRELQPWQHSCTPRRLDHRLLQQAHGQRTRLVAHYAPAHRLAALLLEGMGPSHDLASGGEVLPGMLWNMATLFERAVARLLTEHLPAPLRVDTQHGLGELYTVVSGHTGRRAPNPRPDLVAYRGSQVVAVLDTKYRDLSATSLPRDILYQMSVYSLAFGGTRPVPAIVLYAVPHGRRADTHLRLNVHHGADRDIVLRSVGLDELAACIGQPELARRLAAELVATGYGQATDDTVRPRRAPL